MQTLENIPAEDLPEVVRIASELYDKDKLAEAQRAEADSARRAAEEIGIPAKYMDQAAAEVHARRVGQVVTKRQSRTSLLAIAAAFLLIAISIWMMMRMSVAPSIAPPAVIMATPVASANLTWELDKNNKTSAQLSAGSIAGEDAQVLLVDGFMAESNGSFKANIDSELTRNLAGKSIAKFHIMGSGLKHIRLYLEVSPTERWRSRALSIPENATEMSLKLNEFDHQIRSSSLDQWQTIRGGSPQGISRISWKLGSFINAVTDKGEVAVTEPQFE